MRTMVKEHEEGGKSIQKGYPMRRIFRDLEVFI